MFIVFLIDNVLELKSRSDTAHGQEEIRDSRHLLLMVEIVKSGKLDQPTKLPYLPNAIQTGGKQKALERLVE